MRASKAEQDANEEGGEPAWGVPSPRHGASEPPSCETPRATVGRHPEPPDAPSPRRGASEPPRKNDVSPGQKLAGAHVLCGSLRTCR